MLFATGTALNETEPVPVENNVLATEANKEVYHYKKINTFIFLLQSSIWLPDLIITQRNCKIHFCDRVSQIYSKKWGRAVASIFAEKPMFLFCFC